MIKEDLLDYDEKYRQKLKENINEVIFLLENDENMRKKVQNWADKFNYIYDEVEQHIKEDDMFRCCFAKDPNKQRIHQNIAR